MNRITTLLLVIATLVFSCKSEKEPLGGERPISMEAQAGESIFMTHCQKCHPGGDAGLGPSIINNKQLPGFTIRMQVRQGIGKMPKFNKEELSEEELDGIIAYITEIRKN